MPFSKDVLDIDAEKEVERISKWLRETLSKKLKRRGLVVALSGGIDSSVTTGLAIEAVGKERVQVLLLPELHSSKDTLTLSQSVVNHFDAQSLHEDITNILETVRFYRRYNDAVRMIIPEYGKGWKSKIIIPNVLEKKGFSYFSIVAENPEGERLRERLPLKAYLEIVAASNFKQRIRKMLEYYHADRLNYAVTGTPNRLEYDQGFFVKLGDGSADVKPIAHLYKTQVYKLAEFFGIPENVRKRPPTTDTYSLPQGQDEFYFSLPYEKMDLCLYAKNNGVPVEEVADVIDITIEQVQAVFDDISTKRSTTRYLHLPAQLIEEVKEIK